MKKQYIKVKFTNDYTSILEIEPSSSANLIIARITQAAKQKGIKNKIVDWELVNEKGEELFPN